VSSLCGVFVIPLSNKKIYKKLLMFLIAIAVGSLAGSGFLHLIPQVKRLFLDSVRQTRPIEMITGEIQMEWSEFRRFFPTDNR
jgi:hypothetical protein